MPEDGRLQLRKPPYSELTVRKLCDLRRGLYASPDYLERKGGVKTLVELTHHDAIVFREPSGRLRRLERARWCFGARGVAPAGAGAGRWSSPGGRGACRLRYHADTRRGRAAACALSRLVHLLPQADVNGPPVHAIISLGQKMAAKRRAVVNHLAETFRQTGQ
jgi:hypothetical protein